MIFFQMNLVLQRDNIKEKNKFSKLNQRYIFRTSVSSPKNV